MYCIDPSADEPIMLINKHIGFDEKDGQGVDGSLFQNELLQLDRMGKKRIQVWINSPGGTVMDGYSIYNAILKSETKVDTYCVGIAGSIAAVIFQAGRKRVMADYGLLMYHNPYGGSGGNELDAMRNSIVTMIASRTGKTQAEIKKVMDKTTWIEAPEALDNGFCDAVEASVDLNKKRLIGAGDAKAMFVQGNKVLNSILNEIQFPKEKTTTMSMKLVTNKLGLNPEATEDSILNAIQDIQNKAAAQASELNTALNKAKGEMDEANNKAAKLEKDMKEAKEKYDALKAEYDKLKTEKEEGEKKAKDEAKVKETEDCKNMLDGYVTQGRIKSDAVDGWQNKVKEGKLTIAEVKDMIEALPLSKTANKVVEQLGGSGADAEKKLTNVIASTMATVRNRIESRGEN